MKIIAECGVNWRNLKEAKVMVEKAKESGCWAVKFQLFNLLNIRELPDKIFQSLKYKILTKHSAEMLVERGKDVGIEVFFTPMYPQAVDICEAVGVNYYKIRYADQGNYDLYKKIKRTKKPVFVSCSEINGSMWNNYIKYQNGVFLYCVPNYPAKENDYLPFVYAFDGVSDHTSGVDLIKAAKEFGYRYFEKHVKLDDACVESAWSVNFEELKEVLNS